MKTKNQLEQSLTEIRNTIENYLEKVVDAMVDGNSFEEHEYGASIRVLEQKREVLEWVLS